MIIIVQVVTILISIDNVYAMILFVRTKNSYGYHPVIVVIVLMVGVTTGSPRQSGQNRDGSKVGEILTTVHQEFGGCAHHHVGKPKCREQDQASPRRRGCVWSVMTMTFCNPHQCIPKPSAPFPSPQAHSRNPTLIPDSKYLFPIMLDHFWPNRLYLSFVISSSLSLASSHTLLYLYLIPSIWLPKFSISIKPIPSNP